MKKISLVLLCLLTAVANLMAQPGKTPVKTAPASPLKTISDSASYAVGMSVATFYKQQGIKTFNTTLVARAINDVMSGKKTLMDETEANTCMNNYVSRLQTDKSKPRIDSGAAFLAKNKLRAGVKTTPSGLQYEVIKEGTGPHPTAKDSVTCNYKGQLLDGTVFDNSYDRGQPITFPLDHVIPGWTEGLQLMSVGSKYRFFIPYNLAYGAFDYGPIPGGSMLTFEVELLDVKKTQ